VIWLGLFGARQRQPARDSLEAGRTPTIWAEHKFGCASSHYIWIITHDVCNGKVHAESVCSIGTQEDVMPNAAKTSWRHVDIARACSGHDRGLWFALEHDPLCVGSRGGRPCFAHLGHATKGRQGRMPHGSVKYKTQAHRLFVEQQFIWTEVATVVYILNVPKGVVVNILWFPLVRLASQTKNLLKP
jgi:hypothetical protein